VEDEQFQFKNIQVTAG